MPSPFFVTSRRLKHKKRKNRKALDQLILACIDWLTPYVLQLS